MILKHLGPFLEEINAMRIKCSLQAVGEVYSAVQYGLMVFALCDLWVVATIPCCPCAPSWRCLQGLDPGPGRGGKAPVQRSREQECRREMKAHGGSVSELEMAVLAAVPCPEKLHSQK